MTKQILVQIPKFLSKIAVQTSYKEEVARSDIVQEEYKLLSEGTKENLFNLVEKFSDVENEQYRKLVQWLFIVIDEAECRETNPFYQMIEGTRNIVDSEEAEQTERDREEKEYEEWVEKCPDPHAIQYKTDLCEKRHKECMMIGCDLEYLWHNTSNLPMSL